MRDAPTSPAARTTAMGFPLWWPFLLLLLFPAIGTAQRVKNTSHGTISEIELEKIPTARDPWQIIQPPAGPPPGASAANPVVVDGLFISEDGFQGGTAFYYEFGAFGDVEQGSPGATLNLVTRNGSNVWQGSSRYLLTDIAPDLLRVTLDSDGSGGACIGGTRWSWADGTGDAPGNSGEEVLKVDLEELYAELQKPPRSIDIGGDGEADGTGILVPGCEEGEPTIVFEFLIPSGDGPAGETRTTSDSFDEELFRDLPTTRTFTGLAFAAPGVVGGGLGSEGAGLGPLAAENRYVIDGLEATDPSFGTIGRRVPAEFVREVEVRTGGYEAEYGGALGGLLNVITKSGGNELEGDVFAYYDDDELSEPPPELEGYDFGAGIGGYFIKDKLWFFLGPSSSREELPPVLPGNFLGDVPEDIFDVSGDGSPDIRVSWVGDGSGMTSGLLTDIPSHLYFGPEGVLPVDLWNLDFGSPDGAGAYSNDLDGFYLKGRYDAPQGDPRPGPEGGPPSSVPVPPDAGVLFLGLPGDGSAIPGSGAGTVLPDLNGDGTGEAFLLDPTRLRSFCDGGAVGAAFSFGPGGSLIFDDVQFECPPGGFDGAFLQNAFRSNDFFTMNLGVREPAGSEREYEAVELSLNKRFSNNWQLFASSVYSKNQGRYGDLFREGGLDPNITSLYDLPDLLENSYDGWRWRPFDGSYPGNGWQWFWGVYGESGEEDRNDLADRAFLPLGLDIPRGNVGDILNRLNPSLVQEAPEAEGVQRGGVEARVESDERSGLAEDRFVPGGGVIHDDELPVLYFVAKGGSTGEVMDLEVVHPPGAPVPLEGYLALEPVAATGADRARFERELAEMEGVRESGTVAFYCLEFAADAPPAGTVFRVADRAAQEAFAPAARAFDAARRLHEAGMLDPDTDPESYFHSIRQWAVWTLEKDFDADEFVDAFLEHTRKNVDRAGQEWSEEIADIVRTSAERRWRDVSQVLEESTR